VLPTAYRPLDKPGRLEHTDVPGYAREGHRKRASEIGDPQLAIAKRDQQRPARRIGQSGIRSI
jgi:hypothetical protein